MSDRFHVIENISEHSKDGFKRELPASFRIEEADDQGIESDCCVHFECHEAHLPEKNYKYDLLQKMDFRVVDIAKEADICYGTAKNINL